MIFCDNHPAQTACYYATAFFGDRPQRICITCVIHIIEYPQYNDIEVWKMDGTGDAYINWGTKLE